MAKNFFCSLCNPRITGMDALEPFPLFTSVTGLEVPSKGRCLYRYTTALASKPRLHSTHTSYAYLLFSQQRTLEIAQMSTYDHRSLLETCGCFDRFSLQSSPVLCDISSHCHFTVYPLMKRRGYRQNMYVQQSEKVRQKCFLSELRKRPESLGPSLTAAAI